jgi:hypothetical protein
MKCSRMKIMVIIDLNLRTIPFASELLIQQIDWLIN